MTPELTAIFALVTGIVCQTVYIAYLLDQNAKLWNRCKQLEKEIYEIRSKRSNRQSDH